MPAWTWNEIETLWDYPDFTARELAEYLPRHSESSIRRMRSRVGRYNAARAPLCSKCGMRHVWLESPIARRYGLCKGCYLDEERMRIEDEGKKAVALRQRRRKAKKRMEGK